MLKCFRVGIFDKYLVFSIVLMLISPSTANSAKQITSSRESHGSTGIDVRTATVPNGKPATAQQYQGQRKGRPKFVQNQVLVKLKSPKMGASHIGTASQEDQLKSRLVAKHNIRRMTPLFKRSEKRKKTWLKSLYRIDIGANETPLGVAKALEKDPDVEWAEPNYYRWALATHADDSNGLWHISSIEAPLAWDYTTGSLDVVIAVIDSGVDWQHADLAANIWSNSGEVDGDSIDNDNNGFVDDIRGWDFVDVPQSDVYSGEDAGPPDNNPMDFLGHGTHVAGIIGAVGNNGTGVAGVNWTVSLMPLRAGFKDTDGDGVLTVSAIADALMYAADNGAHIVNMSFGSDQISRTEREAIDYCAAAGVLLVAAAGNDNKSAPFYPAAYNSVLAIVSVDSNHEKSSFSNYGLWVDLAAPGGDVKSTLPGGSYGFKSGTSMASPVVAGVAGLIKSLNPAWSAERIAEQLRATTENINGINTAYTNLLGSGLTRADQAVTATVLPPKLGLVCCWTEESSGDGDDRFDPGETLELMPSIKNFGLAQAGVSLLMTTTDPYISIIDSTVDLGLTRANRIETNPNDPLAITISPGVPEAYTAQLTLETHVDGLGLVASDEITLLLNEEEVILSDPLIIAGVTDDAEYFDPDVVAHPTGEVTVIYHSQGNNGRHLFARTRDLELNWQPQVSVSGGLTVERAYEVESASDGSLHLVFDGYAAGGRRVYYVHRDTNGQWGTPFQLSGPEAIIQGSGVPGIASAIAVGVDETDNPHVVWADYRSGNAEIFHTTNDGSGWSSEALIVQPSTNVGLIDLLYDTSGNGYVIWSPWDTDFSIHMAKWNGIQWGPPETITTVNCQWNPTGFTAAMDSQNRLHLTYSSPSCSDISYMRYDGSGWSNAQVVSPRTFYNGPVPLIAIDPADFPHIVKVGNPAWPNGEAQLLETAYDGANWNFSPLTSDPGGINVASVWTDFAINPWGAKLVTATAYDADYGGLLLGYSIEFRSSDSDASLRPTRPTVWDDGFSTTDSATLHCSWLSSDPNGIAEYVYAIGTAPGQADFRDWKSAGFATEVTLDLTDTPLKSGQRYFISVRSFDNSGYASSIGSSDGILYSDELMADFFAAPTTGYFPLEVAFTDASTGAVETRAWDVDNDGTVDSYDLNPSWTYTEAGDYTVSLTVSGPGGSITETKIDYIHVMENQPPNEPSSPSPANGAAGVGLTSPVLNWSGIDPDPGDTVTYDVYFGASNPTKLKSSNQASTSYTLGDLNCYRIYYWQIVARDDKGEETSGPIWSFTTTDAGCPVIEGVAPNPSNPKDIVTISGQNFGTTKQVIRWGTSKYKKKRIVSWTNTRIDFKVKAYNKWLPGTSRTKDLWFKVGPGGSKVKSNRVPLTITKP